MLFFARSPHSRTRSPSLVESSSVVAVGDVEELAANKENVSTPRSRASSSCATPPEAASRKMRGHEAGNLLEDVSRALRAQMRARARKAAMDAQDSPSSSTSSLSSVELLTPASTPSRTPPILISDWIGAKGREEQSRGGLRPFPSSSPPLTNPTGSSSARSRQSSNQSHVSRPSRSRSSRLAQTLTRSSTPRNHSSSVTSVATADLLINRLAPLPRFNPFEKRRRSESLSAIVGKDSARSKDTVRIDGAGTAKVCRRMSTWSCLRSACQPEGHALSGRMLRV